MTLTWYDGGLKPPRPKDLEPDRGMGDVIYIGDKGKLMGHRLIPESQDEGLRHAAQDAAAFARPLQGMGRRLPRRPAGRLQFRRPRRPADRSLPAGQRRRCGPARSWPGTARTEVTNDEAANRLLHREYRQGWTL